MRESLFLDGYLKIFTNHCQLTNLPCSILRHRIFAFILLSFIYSCPGWLHAEELAVSSYDRPLSTDQTIDSKALEIRSQHLRELLAAYQAAAGSEKDQILLRMEGAAKARRTIVESLMQTRPQDVPALAMTPAQRSQFPESIQADLEEPVSLEGTLQILIEEDFEQGRSATSYRLMIGRDRYVLHFSDAESQSKGLQPSKLVALRTGEMVRVEGVKIGRHVMVVSYHAEQGAG